MPAARSLSLLFSAGAFGGVANGLALWSCSRLGLLHALGIHLAAPGSPAWLYPRIVWGGLYGLLFALSFPRSGWIRRGLVFGLVPSLVQLFVVFPLKTDGGALGLGFGALTPLAVLCVNAVWGLATGWWLRLARAPQAG